MQFSIIKRAIEKKIIEVEIVDFREYSTDKGKHVDDYQYGGGAGMVLKLEPIIKALRSIDTGHKILLSPQGKILNQEKLFQLSKLDKIILLCGHYEGFDERINHYIDEEISIGDYILTNGEIPALIILDGVSRLLSGVIREESRLNESFTDNLLDYPVYTKPLEFEGHKVPEVLLSGNHKNIQNYRLQEKIKKTKTKRPDLYKKYQRSKNHEQNGN